MSAPRAPPEPLPSELNTSSGSLAFLEVGKDKLSVRYSGPAQHDNDVGSIQSDHPAPRRRLLCYFEVRVTAASGGSIAVGFSDRAFKHGRHPGYEPHSYGYRGDTGRKHHSSLPLRGEEYGPSFGPGDVVGAGIHLARHEIFFTKNGQHLGVAFRSVCGHPLYPTIGLHSQGACVEVNFGQRPFEYDVGQLAAAERRQLAQALEGTAVSAGEAHQLVRRYLRHYGYAASLAAFDAAAGMAGADGGGAGGEAGAERQGAPEPAAEADGGGAAPGADADDGSLPLRARLRALLMAGDVAGARALLQARVPGLLAPAAPGGTGGTGGTGSFELQFHLACQQYIELIRAGDVAGALGFASGTLCALRGASPAHDALLRDVVALIAYQRPEQSPLAALLSPLQREATADVANAAVLRALAPPGAPEPQAALEVVLQQLVAVQRELHELAGGHGPEFDLSEHLPQAQLLGGLEAAGSSEAAGGRPAPMAE